MNGAQKFLATILGYNKKVKIYKKVGNVVEKVYDLGKGVKSKYLTRKLLLYGEGVSLPYPPSSAMIDGRIVLYSPTKDEFAYCEEIMDLDRIETKTIDAKDSKGEPILDKKGNPVKETIKTNKLVIKALDSDIIFWEENEIVNAMNKYSVEQNFFDKYAPMIMLAVFFIVMAIGCYIYFSKIILPALETAKNFTHMNITCNSGAIPYPTNITPPL
jgi:hypothetical protein